MSYSMKMGSKQKHDPNNFSQKDQNTMAKIPGSDNPANYRKQSLGLLGFIGGAAGKAAMKVAAKLTGHKAVKVGNKIFGYEKGGKMTNSFQGLFNRSVKDKPAYGIDQYSYAKTKGRASVEAIKKGYPSVDPNLLKKYPTGPKLHKFHKDEVKKFMNKK